MSGSYRCFVCRRVCRDGREEAERAGDPEASTGPYCPLLAGPDCCAHVRQQKARAAVDRYERAASLGAKIVSAQRAVGVLRDAARAFEFADPDAGLKLETEVANAIGCLAAAAKQFAKETSR